MVFLVETAPLDVPMPMPEVGMTMAAAAAAHPNSSSSGTERMQPSEVIEDEVDQILCKEDGRIHRQRNEQL